MAAVNFTPIQLYNSTTLSAVPSAANLANGELAINIRDGTLYYKDWNGVVQVIATKGAGTIGGSTTQIQYNNAGALAGNAAMTFNSGTSTATLTTLNLTNALGATYGGTAQSTYTQGDFVYASAANTLSKLGIGTINYILTSTGSVPQWVAPSSIAVLTATNLAGGLAGSVPYQSALDTTTFLAIGAANRVMTSTGTAPQWVTSLTGLTGVSSSSITDSGLTSGRVTFASTSGLLADSANLTFNGTTLTTAGLSNSGFSTLVKTLTLGDTSFNGTAVFAAATPAKLYMGTGTVTDVTSAISATNTTGAIASLAITPIDATNTGVTYTNAATLYIAGAPSAGTNVTLTNPYSLYVAGGASYFGGAVDFAVTPSYSGGTANGVMFLNGSKQITTGTALTFDGTTATTPRLAFGGTTLPSAGTATIFGRSSDNNLYLQSGSGNDINFIDGSQNTMLTLAPATLTFQISNVNKLTLNSTALALQVGVSLTGGTSGTGYSFSGSAPATSLTLTSAGNFYVGATTNLNGNNVQLSAGSGASSAPYAAIFNTATTPTSSASTRFDLGFLSGASNYVATGTILGQVNFMGQANDDAYGGAYMVAEVTSGGNVARASGHSVDLKFGTKSISSTGMTEVGRFTSAGNLSITNGNVVIGTAGKGIDFSATSSGSGTMTSELLADYEEGTWTPGFTGTVVGTLTTDGKYTKIGNIVYWTATITATTSTTAVADTAVVENFPFVGVNFTYACSIMNRGNSASIGVAHTELSTGATYVYTPGWTAVASVGLSGFYSV